MPSPTSAEDLTFASVAPRLLIANVKSKPALEHYVCWCPFGFDIRKQTRRDTLRMSEPGHQRERAAPPVDQTRSGEGSVSADCPALLHHEPAPAGDNVVAMVR